MKVVIGDVEDERRRLGELEVQAINWPKLRKELVHSAAVAVALIEAGDLRADTAQEENSG